MIVFLITMGLLLFVIIVILKAEANRKKSQSSNIATRPDEPSDINSIFEKSFAKANESQLESEALKRGEVMKKNKEYQDMTKEDAIAVLRSRKKGHGWIAVFVVIVTGGYFGGSLYFDTQVSETVQELLSKEMKSQVKVESVSFNEWYIFGNFRHGKAFFRLGDKIDSVNFTATGNGLWNGCYVEISGEELLKLHIRKLFK